MNEEEYQRALKKLEPNRCIFEKAVFTRYCECQYASRVHLADRQTVQCDNAFCRRHCGKLLALLRENSKFLMHQINMEEPLPHAKELQVQIGGLLGLHAVTFPEMKVERIHDVISTVDEARSRFDHFSELPMEDIMQSIAHFSFRKPKSTPG